MTFRAVLKGVAISLVVLIVSPFTAPFRTCELPGQPPARQHVSNAESSLVVVVRAPSPGRARLHALVPATSAAVAQDAVVVVGFSASGIVEPSQQGLRVLRI